MEYMLMKDDSVIPYELIDTTHEIRAALVARDARAYYWFSRVHGAWMEVLPDVSRAGRKMVEDLPCTVKLAIMME